MKNKRLFLINILLIISLLSLVGCNKSKNVKITEVKEFTKSISRSNNKIIELNFYFQRPSLRAELVYDSELDKKELDTLVGNFKELINVEFMQKIGNKYFSGNMPTEFNLYIYVDDMKDMNDYDYLVHTNYYKTYRVDEDPENIDGYETWKIHDIKE